VTLGVFTVWVVSVIIFFATEVLPGNAAYAILGHSATPGSIRALEIQMHLNRPLVDQYGGWVGGLLTGHLGTSLANGEPVSTLIGPRLVNSAALVLISGVVGSLVGVTAGVFAALRRGRVADETMSVLSLTFASLPEFVVAIGLIIVFATLVFHILPAVSIVPPGTYAWSTPKLLILPVLTLVLVIAPYIFRMTRSAMIEALESEYVELARLVGLPTWRVLLVHALPNVVPTIVQVVGLNVLYLAGGIVVVEYVYDYPGIGQALVSAVSNRDIPVIQFIVVVLASFYVFMNIVTDVIALYATPRRRIPRR
jgi:peptide/nickel transport system permease protein